MLPKDLFKHAREFMRALRNNHWEQTDSGLLFPNSGAVIRGEFYHSVNGEDERIDSNLITNEGLNYLLESAVVGGTAAISNWYLALWGANITPDGSITAASFPDTAGELTSNTDGYAETSRLQFQATRTADGVVDNLANRADFTITTSTSVTIAGAAVLSESAKGATTGVLLSISRFSQTRTQYDGDIFSVGYKLVLASV